MASTSIFCCLVFSFLCVGVKSDRKVVAELNPGCPLISCKNNEIILAHVKAEGKNDTLHHFWDFTGKPSLLLALTEPNASVTIQWTSFSAGQQDAIIINPAPKYVYGVVFDKLIEFNDENNTGELNTAIDNSSYVKLWDTKNFDWKVVNLTNSTRGGVTLTIEAEYNDKVTREKKNGTAQIVVSAYGGEDHADSLPHLLHSGNASQLDLSLNGLATQFKSSRFGVHLVLASSDSPNNTVEQKPSYRKTMDDEHAPGIFTIVEILTPSAKEGKCGGYLQWRPVVYTSSSRDMTSSTETAQYQIAVPDDSLRAVDRTLLYTVLGTRLASMLVLTTNVTFGVKDDGFYRKHQYTAWTLLVGYGHPPEEHFSMLVTLVLLIGLGLPAILILTGTVCIVLRRLQRNKDDLFLSR